MKVTWRPHARRNLKILYAYIGERSVTAAERLIDESEGRTRILATHPRAGVSRPDFGTGIRTLSCDGYLIVYRNYPQPEAAYVQRSVVERVIDGRRDPKTFLQ